MSRQSLDFELLSGLIHFTAMYGDIDRASDRLRDLYPEAMGPQIDSLIDEFRREIERAGREVANLIDKRAEAMYREME